MTKQAAHKTTSTPSGDAPLLFGRMIADLLSTTWRVTVPVLLCAGVGLLIDRRLHTGPWLTLAATVVGLVVAGLLIKRQIARVNGGDQ